MDSIDVPYPADVRAKGWRFELDLEKIEQSDTWALASPDIRPWLLMLWSTAWKQTPCGSLPEGDDLIAARIGMAPKAFSKNRAVMLRGWWKAADGRLYHSTIVGFVLDMMGRRRSEADRKARVRARTPAGVDPCPASVPYLSRGTDAGLHRESDTGTGTGTGISPSLRSGEDARATPGEACKAMRAAGMADVSPAHPKLIALLAAGITVPELVDAAAHAVKSSKPFAYALATAEGRRRDAAIAALPVAANAVIDPESKSAVEAEGIAKGIGAWDGMEQWPVYKARVRGTSAAHSEAQEA